MNIIRILSLVSRIRSSLHFATRSIANFGFGRTPENYDSSVASVCKAANQARFKTVAALQTTTLAAMVSVGLLGAAPKLLITDAFAQGREMNIGDQPGYIPEDEEIAPEFKRTTVFYRTAEPPGTIVISTSERFLYLI